MLDQKLGQQESDPRVEPRRAWKDWSAKTQQERLTWGVRLCVCWWGGRREGPAGGRVPRGGAEASESILTYWSGSYCPGNVHSHSPLNKINSL